MGSGHILVYAFEVLMQMYEAGGYNRREAAQSILENNLYGLDIDDRAAQLAYFAVMMKARSYDRRIFGRNIQPHVYAIRESNGISQPTVDYFCNGDDGLKANLTKVIEQMRDAKEYGSILNVTGVDFAILNARFDEIREDIHILRQSALEDILPMVQCAELLARKYHVVVTNPPYMGGSGMGNKLSEFVKKHYPDSKSDLFAVFMERCGQMAAQNGYQAMITQHAWMFLSSYEKLRGKLLLTDLVNMAHLGARAFEEIGGEVVQTTSFVLRKSHAPRYQGTYCRLIEPTTQQGKEDMFLNGENRYHADQANFSKIPGSPVAYWVSEKIYKCYENFKSLSTVATPRTGIMTGDNSRFLRLWWEISRKKTFLKATNSENAVSSGAKWFPYNKGGEYRRWYGNEDYVLNWEYGGREVFENAKQDKRNAQDYPAQYKFHTAISWSLVTSGMPAFRLKSHNLSDIAGPSLYLPSNLMYSALGFCNSVVALKLLTLTNPTINFQGGNIGDLPYFQDEGHWDIVNRDVCSNLENSRKDWDSYETSWDFKRNPLV